MNVNFMSKEALCESISDAAKAVPSETSKYWHTWCRLGYMQLLEPMDAILKNTEFIVYSASLLFQKCVPIVEIYFFCLILCILSRIFHKFS